MDEKVKAKLLKRAKQGASLNQLVAETGLPKTTIYFHTKENLQRGNSSISLAHLTSREQGYITGLFASDGHLDHQRERYSYRVVFSLHKNEKRICARLCGLIRKAGGNPILLPSRVAKLTRVTCISKTLFGFVSKFAVYTHRMHGRAVIRSKDSLTGVQQKGEDFVFGFLSGYIDGDGHIGLDRGRPRVLIATGFPNMARSIQKLCTFVGIVATIQYGQKNLIVRISTPSFIKYSQQLQCVKSKPFFERTHA